MKKSKMTVDQIQKITDKLGTEIPPEQLKSLIELFFEKYARQIDSANGGIGDLMNIFKQILNARDMDDTEKSILIYLTFAYIGAKEMIYKPEQWTYNPGGLGM